MADKTMPFKLPDNYIDPDLNSNDKKLLEIFYSACLSEGGTTDEVTLRGLRAVLTPVLNALESLRDASIRHHLGVYSQEELKLYEERAERVLQALRP